MTTTPTTPADVPTVIVRGHLRPGRGPCGKRPDAQILILTVRCPACRTTHTHGWGPFDRRPSHRIADCFMSGPPLQDGGYYVIPHDTPRNRDLIARYQALYRRLGLDTPEARGEVRSSVSAC